MLLRLLLLRLLLLLLLLQPLNLLLNLLLQLLQLLQPLNLLLNLLLQVLLQLLLQLHLLTLPLQLLPLHLQCEEGGLLGGSGSGGGGGCRWLLHRLLWRWLHLLAPLCHITQEFCNALIGKTSRTSPALFTQRLWVTTAAVVASMHRSFAAFGKADATNQCEQVRRCSFGNIAIETAFSARGYLAGCECGFLGFGFHRWG